MLKAGQDIRRYSTRSLAEAAYTSPATVIRLCMKPGFTGFGDFKQDFCRELSYLDEQAGECSRLSVPVIAITSFGWYKKVIATNGAGLSD